MEAIVLAGGLGTRLRSVVNNVPKPMAPIGNKPFLDYIFFYLKKNNIKKVILAVGYKNEIIKHRYGNKYLGIDIEYSIEEEQLGTGGAINQAFKFIDEKESFIINGDTFFYVDLNEMYQFHIKNNADLTIAVKPMKNFERYGKVIDNNNKIEKFTEKEKSKKGNINGGIYILNKEYINSLDLPKVFSFEKDIMEKNVNKDNFIAYKSDTYFIDIGIPEDYNKAQKELEQKI
ncbi:nucleotidyltransferase family protein [Haliovirga abyssi]|uniref:D-glycero-D-manno-heptose 1-phosphate guanosyltransferase n=1 Tax=Haliovirga abyssi TaxID=2996794 RepID=A0AAU9E4G9_9FUSO|nr:nucleotidyltransferase family protein [Haliovirga abyssi]BDU51405.1 D-glycero-D-manno-heptose 1-phosphate guanosyltransferase [Haliovirga abyssi]